MTLRMARLPTSALGPEGAQGTVRPRSLRQPDTQLDFMQSKQQQKDGTARLTGLSGASSPIYKEHGNALPQEASFHSTWSLDRRSPRMVQHPHAQTWCASSCPGKTESPEGLNPYHRVWLVESGPRGRWNRDRKKEFYSRQDLERMVKKPADEKHCRRSGNYKFWTHLRDGGLKPGGQTEKLDYSYRGPNTATQHFYVGKFEQVKHCQRILTTGFKDPQTLERIELQRDTRPKFDNRLKDDMDRRNAEADRQCATDAFDIHRPHHTWSCPQLGADFVYRGF